LQMVKGNKFKQKEGDKKLVKLDGVKKPEKPKTVVVVEKSAEEGRKEKKGEKKPKAVVVVEMSEKEGGKEKKREKKPVSEPAPEAVSKKEGGGEEAEGGKKKRPWRNKLRKAKAKEAARAERGENMEGVEEEGGGEGEGEKKKKKKKKKKRNAVLDEIIKDGKAATGRMDEEEEEEGAASSTKGDAKLEDAKEKIKGGIFRYINEQLYTVKSADAVELFKKEPDSFWAYHEGFAQQTKKWPNHPLRLIIQWLLSKESGKVVFDLGCGEAKIAEAVGKRHDVRSFDLVAVNERVTACDMAHLPEKDGTADIVVFCLSLMGTNLLDFIREARRVLKTGGILKIAEVTSRFVNPKMFVDAVCKLGFQVHERKAVTDYFIIMQFIKIDKVENKRPYGLVLKPCLYKKR
ncbi:rrp-8, partial [Pristionchus pacificus]